MTIYRLLLCWLLLTATSALSQRLYVFAVVDPAQRYQPDASRLRSMADSLARYGQYELHWYDFVDVDAFSAETVRATLERFEPVDADRDIIWFHYAGRGYSDGPNAWPTCWFTGQQLPIRDVLASLRAKPVRTLLVTADCANQLRPTPLTNTKPIPPNRPSVVVKSRITNVRPVTSHDTTVGNGYRRLMQADRIRQIIVMSAASHGQRAYRTVRQGSVWLARLDTVMYKLVRTNPADLSWKRIQEHVARLTQEKTQNHQIPQYNRQTRTCCEPSNL